MHQTLLLSWLIIVLFFFLGYGIASILLPKTKPEWRWWLTPWIGTSFLVVSLVIAGLFGLNVSAFGKVLLLIITGLNIVAFALAKKKLVFDKTDLMVALLVAISLFFNLKPLFSNQTPTAISMGNHDVVTYATVADHLIDNPLGQVFKNPSLPKAFRLITEDYRWGTPLLLSFFSYLLNLPSYQLAYILPAIIFSLTIPLVYIFTKEISRSKNFIIPFLAAAFYAFNANLLYILYHVFFGQIIFWGLSLTLIIYTFTYFRSAAKKKLKINKFDLLIALSASAVYFSFHECSVFILASIALYSLIRLIKGNSAPYFIRLAKIALLVFILAPRSIIFHIKFIIHTLSLPPEPRSAIGWQLFRAQSPFPNPAEMLGIQSIHTHAPFVSWLAILLSLAIISIVLIGIKKCLEKSFLLSLGTVFALSLFYCRLIRPHFWLYSRITTLALPIITPIFFIGIYQFYKKSKITLLPIFILLLMVVNTAIKLSHHFEQNMLVVSNDIVSLLNFPKELTANEDSDNSEYIFRLIGPDWYKMWASYFTKIDYLSFQRNQPCQLEDDIQNKLLLLPKKSQPACSSKYLYYDQQWENDYFRLARLCNSDDCLLQSEHDMSSLVFGQSEYEDALLINGWSIAETSSRWGIGYESSLRLVSYDKNYTNLEIKTIALAEPQEIKVYFDDQLIGQQQLKTRWDTYSFALPTQPKKGIHAIVFSYAKNYQPSSLGISNDSRDLAANFQEIRLK